MRTKEYTFYVLRKLGLFKNMSDEKYLRILYKIRIGKKLNLDNPQSFNEKLQWLKIYDRKPIYTKLVDKYEVKKYVSDIIGEEYIIPTLGVYDKFENIEFEKLPNQFVIKCTHDSGGLVVCKDKSKLDYKKVKKRINHCLSRNYYWNTREWPYKDVKPRIIIEKYMEDSCTKDLHDYKFFCFNGKVKCFKIDFDRFVEHRANYYDRNKKLLKFGEIVCPPNYEKIIEMPKNIDKMMELAEKLSENNSFLRVDFYEVDEKIYFGELTFFPASGAGRFTSEEWDYKLGEWLELKNNNYIGEKNE